MTKLKNEFSRKEFKDCCGGGCKKCKLAQAYIAEYGSRKEGLEKLNARHQGRQDGLARRRARRAARRRPRPKKKAKA